MTPLEIVYLIAPEFHDVPQGKILQLIEIVKPLVSKKKYGDLYNQAIALLVCHKMKLAGLGPEDELGSIADSLRVSSYSEGSRSVSFGGLSSTVGATDAELGLTIYGVQYLNLRRMVIIPITVSGGDYDGGA